MSTSAPVSDGIPLEGLGAPADTLPAWIKITRRQMASLLVMAAVFWYLTWIPLWHTDVFGHLQWGQWIWQNKAIPSSPLFMPLSEGVRCIDYPWLSQLVFYGAYSVLGYEGLSLLYVLTLVTVLGFLFRALFQATGRLWVAVPALAALYPILWPNMMAIRPQMFGALAFVVLLHVTLLQSWRRANWLIVPLLFAAWANLHSSFVMGAAVLVCRVAGAAIDAWRAERRFGAIFADDDTRRWFVVSELAFVACLVNPYGLDLLRDVLAFAGSPNLRDVNEWQPLNVRMLDGISFAASIVVLVCLLRLSRRPVRGAEALMMLVFGIAALPYVRFVQWWGLLLPYVVMPHAGEILDRMRGGRLAALVPSFKYTVIAATVAWICFALSATGFAFVRRHPRKLASVLSRQTPIDAAAYLRKHPREGLVFAPIEWGDWLSWAGDVRCVVTSHIHLIPNDIWRAYHRIGDAHEGWENTVGGLGIRTVVIDKERQKSLLREVRSSPHWKVVHEDKLALVAERIGHRAVESSECGTEEASAADQLTRGASS
jgi:hypothetical protein